MHFFFPQMSLLEPVILSQVLIALFYFLIAHVLEYKCMFIHVTD